MDAHSCAILVDVKPNCFTLQEWFCEALRWNSPIALPQHQATRFLEGGWENPLPTGQPQSSFPNPEFWSTTKRFRRCQQHQTFWPPWLACIFSLQSINQFNLEQPVCNSEILNVCQHSPCWAELLGPECGRHWFMGVTSPKRQVTPNGFCKALQNPSHTLHSLTSFTLQKTWKQTLCLPQNAGNGAKMLVNWGNEPI